MPSETLHTEAFVLTKRPSAADGWQACTLFSPEHGPLHALQRVPKKQSKTQVMLDMFDEATLELESSNQGRTWFVREARIIARHAGIGRSYEALKGASAFVRIVARNPVSEESRGAVASLLRAALAAFAEAARPDIVLFKCLYRFARDEGYPVKQEWFPSIPPADREIVAALLNRPLPEQTVPPETVARLQHLLDDYLRNRTDILME